VLNELGESAEAEAAQWRAAQALLGGPKGVRQRMTPLEREALREMSAALTLPPPPPPEARLTGPGKKMKVACPPSHSQ
jgi:hypothetical protein